MGLINSDYHICTILYNMCQVFNQVFDTHYTLQSNKITKLSVETYKQFIILYEEVGKW